MHAILLWKSFPHHFQLFKLEFSRFLIIFWHLKPDDKKKLNLIEMWTEEYQDEIGDFRKIMVLIDLSRSVFMYLVLLHSYYDCCV